jgi:hypothetical protein
VLDTAPHYAACPWKDGSLRHKEISGPPVPQVSGEYHNEE